MILGDFVDGLGVGVDGVEAGSDRGLGTPAALAATQSFQSLECLFLSRFNTGKTLLAIARRLAISVYTRHYEQAGRSVARIVHACAVLTLADSSQPHRNRNERD